jgi:hypothetical protein
LYVTMFQTFKMMKNNTQIVDSQDHGKSFTVPGLGTLRFFRLPTSDFQLPTFDFFFVIIKMSC